MFQCHCQYQPSYNICQFHYHPYQPLVFLCGWIYKASKACLVAVNAFFTKKRWEEGVYTFQKPWCALKYLALTIFGASRKLGLALFVYRTGENSCVDGKWQSPNQSDVKDVEDLLVTLQCWQRVWWVYNNSFIMLRLLLSAWIVIKSDFLAIKTNSGSV